MPRKTIIIFITVFIVIGTIMVGGYFFFVNKSGNQNNTGDNSGNGWQIFNPFGGGSTKDTTGQNIDNQIVDNQTAIPDNPLFTVNSKFQQLTQFGVAGAVFFEDERPLPTETTENSADTKKTAKPKYETVPSLRYVERATGHIYQMYLDTKYAGKVSNSTIPAIYEAVFNDTAKSVIYRYLSSEKVITTFLATLGGTNSSFLPENITSLVTSPDKSKFFYLIENKNGVIGATNSFDSSKSSQVFSSAFSEWLPQWVTDKTIYLTTKPSFSVNGSMFSLNTSNGSMFKVFGGIPGLTTLSNNTGNIVLYSASTSTGPKMSVFNTKINKSTETNTYGLPEKCIWSKDNINVYCAVPRSVYGSEYPDSWYQGLVSFDDNFIKINTEDNSISIIADGSNGFPVDATHLFFDKDENTLFFINKKDSTLWSLDLN